ncbi:MAG: EamA family transporter [Ectothiorhodospiraceae bacterium]|nr:EamA family transporter [Ectothiorhodospiraceae bacterium]
MANDVRSAPSVLSGLLLAIAVAVSFATNSALARIAYEAGSNALSVLTVRTSVALVALLVLLTVQRVPYVLPAGRAVKALALGLVLASYSYGLLGSFQYVPLAVGIVTFYTYPLLTAFASAATGRERITVVTLAALAAAFVGLTLVVDLRGGGFDPVGIAHAFAAAIFFTALLLLSDRVRGDGDSRPITLHMLLTGVICYGGACVLTGLFRLPQTPLGWAGFLGNPVFYSFSIICLFVAVRRIGPVRAALILNVEPVASAVLGYLLLDQTLTPLQMAGIAMVVGAVLSLRLSPGMLVRPRVSPMLWPVTSLVTGCLLMLGSAVAWLW